VIFVANASPPWVLILIDYTHVLRPSMAGDTMDRIFGPGFNRASRLGLIIFMIIGVTAGLFRFTWTASSRVAGHPRSSH